MAKSPISPEVMNLLLRYEPETGKLFWRHRPEEFFTSERDWKRWNSRYAGQEAFTARMRAYHVGAIFGVQYLRHRVVWAMHYGAWPSDVIDHIDGDTDNDRIENLRDVPKSLNQRNARKQRNNTSGVTGVLWNDHAQKWQAYLSALGPKRHLGLFTDINDAIAARKEAETGHGFTDRHGT